MLNYRTSCFVVSFITLLLLVFPGIGFTSAVGIYGVHIDAPELSEYSIKKVFARSRLDLVTSQAAAGREVYLSMNVFGGSGAWKKFPDSRPVTADGAPIEKALGGVCPSHMDYRASRLELLSSWFKDGGKSWPIDGAWLDFIRYPGRWEQLEPNIPDTCYCERCIKKFQGDSEIKIPETVVTTLQTSNWIRSNAPLKWTNWKKEQIVSFVSEARKIIDKSSGDRKLQLGVFLVPWTKSDHAGKLSFNIAQDAELLAPYVDVFSPMVYHEMVGQPVGWIGEISDYVAEMTGKPVWPIIQSHDISGQEFGEAIEAVNRSEADGLLVYSFKGFRKEHWPELTKYEPKKNLIHNPLLAFVRNEGSVTTQEEGGRPNGWTTPSVDAVIDTKFLVEPQESGQGNAIGIKAGSDQQGLWSSKIDVCIPGKQYLFSGEFIRGDRSDGSAYPEVVIWGEKYRLNTHRMTGRYQKLQQLMRCPTELPQAESIFEFQNNSPGNTFLMRNPRLTVWEPPQRRTQSLPVETNNFFPIGTYGAKASNLKELKEIGLNSGVVGLNKETLEACLELNMRCTLGVPRNPEKLIVALDRYEKLISQGRFSFYVNDEPGIHTFPEGKATDINRIIKERFPMASTNMAVVRPQTIPFYDEAADFFMLDQYPVPNMPISWLSDSMDEAAEYVGRGRLQSVIQAFGGEKFATAGWPRLPSFEEMDCLAFLSVIHGSRGIYFYTYPSISATEQGLKDFARVIRRLNGLRSWLVKENTSHSIPVKMLSHYGYDPAGNPAVHCASKEQFGTKMLMCANTLRNFSVAEVTVPENSKRTWRDYYGNARYYSKDNRLRVNFKPLEVRVLME